MQKLTGNYRENVAMLDGLLRVDASFDVIKKVLRVGQDELTLYYIDGFVKDTVMQKLLLPFVSLPGLGGGAEAFVRGQVTYVEADVTESVETMITMVLSGATVMLGSTFGAEAIIIDARTYPSRSPDEPENDRVMRGARDGFVETLVFNTALIRRRIRDPRLTMAYHTVGAESRTDVVLCYLEGKADPGYVDYLRSRLGAIRTDALPMGHQSLAECLIKTRWYNPFPKIRCTERPDAAAASLLEGSVLLLCDNSPEAMILPTSIFDFLQETGDYYFPPITGCYVRLLRHAIFWVTLFLTPLWYLLIQNPEWLPGWMAFIIPTEQARIPIFAQLLLTEFVIDGLKLASMNTPSMLTNSLSVVGGLILGDFAVDIGWLLPEVILYMAFVAIANFTQPSYELGYAFKFLRVGLLILTALFGVWGFLGGLVGCILLLASNATVNRRRSYLYPLIPFNGHALKRLFFRVQK
ncbi:MAG: spore germination protein [Clostridia bacterium]|nr:spore germination protein [Clostridia bacterium]